jgi:hypothetical protein
MWFADIYCDPAWVAERKGILGPARFRLRGPKSASLGIEIEFHFFGDEERVRHFRVLMHTEDQRIADSCVNLNIQTWVASLEVSIMVETKQPFQVARLLPGSQTFAVVLGQGADDSPAVLIQFAHSEAPTLSYQRIAYGFAPWGGDFSHHLFYFRRLVDSSLPLDVRWLNGYRLLEWQFVGKRAGLAKCPQWRTFVARFDDMLKPLLRPNQTAVGLLEEGRAMAAHAGIDDRSAIERARDPRNALEKTFRILELMVITVLNENALIATSPIKFEGPPRS